MLLQNHTCSSMQRQKALVMDTSNLFCLCGANRSPRTGLFAIWGLGTHPPPISAQNGSTVVLTAFNHPLFSFKQGGGLYE